MTTEPLVNFWVAPDGRKYETTFAHHYDVAHRIRPDSVDPVSELMESGWVHVSRGRIDLPYRARIRQAQLDTLWDAWFIINGTPPVSHLYDSYGVTEANRQLYREYLERITQDMD